MAPTMAFFSFVVVLLGFAHLATSQTTIRFLPGFDGPLPFDLETGYIGVDVDGLNEEIQLFYYFLKSERSPRDDPLILWLPGGPRCSALSAFVYEVGPLKFEMVEYNGSIPNFVPNPYSWTKVSNIIFLDTPVGSGFSFSRDSKGYEIDDIESAKAIYQFLRKWLIVHPQFLSNPLYITGISYAGKILPLVVQEIANGIEAAHKPLLNLKGYLLGNPATTNESDVDRVLPFAHGMGLISNELYESTKKSCDGDYLKPRNLECSKNLVAVNESLSGLFRAHILEPKCIFVSPKPIEMVGDRRRIEENYKKLNLPQPSVYLIGDAVPDQKFDFHAQFLLSNIMKVIRDECHQSPFFTMGHRTNRRSLTESDRYHLISALPYRIYWYLLSYFWANNDTVRQALNIQKRTVREWKRCNHDLPSTKEVQSTIEYHKNLTTRGYRALIYSGDHDLSIPFVSTQSWITSLNFSIINDSRPWFVDGQIAGYTRTYSNNLTFTTVKGAGHTAPEYKPKECLAMLQRWLSHIPL